jgi:hypothetical protein
MSPLQPLIWSGDRTFLQLRPFTLWVQRPPNTRGLLTCEDVAEHAESRWIQAELVRQPGKIVLDPKTDFTVVCANCHRMLHRGSPPPSVNELLAGLRPS